MSTANNNGTVLLVMDIQKQMMSYLPDPNPLLNSVNAAVTSARDAGMEVIYMVLSFRNGYPEINPRHKTFSGIMNSGGLFTEEHEGTAVHQAVAPKEGELVLPKRRVSGFAGSDLEMVLKAKNTHHLVISGFATSGIVLNTIREAADKDYQLTILSDACADPVSETHDFLMKKIFPASGEVITTEEWTKSLTK